MRFSGRLARAGIVAAGSLWAGGAAANPQECQQLTGQYTAVKATIAEADRDNYVFKAADKGCVELTRELIADGAVVTMRRVAGETALHHAAVSGEIEVAKVLIDKGADINFRDLNGSTPLFRAAEANHGDFITFLLQQHADPSIPGRSGVTPLSAAAFNGNRKALEALIVGGANPGLVDDTGKSAIVYAANRGFTDIVERLLTAGVSIDAVYGNDLTTLMWAAGYSDDVPEDDGVKTVQLLIDKGAKLDHQDNRGYTALTTAAELGHEGVVKLLLQRAADRAIKDKEGKTAADRASTDSLKALLK